MNVTIGYRAAEFHGFSPSIYIMHMREGAASQIFPMGCLLQRSLWRPSLVAQTCYLVLTPSPLCTIVLSLSLTRLSSKAQ